MLVPRRKSSLENAVTCPRSHCATSKKNKEPSSPLALEACSSAGVYSPHGCPLLACDVFFPTQGFLCVSGGRTLTRWALLPCSSHLGQMKRKLRSRSAIRQSMGVFVPLTLCCSCFDPTGFPGSLRTPSQAQVGNSSLLLLQLPQVFLSHPADGPQSSQLTVFLNLLGLGPSLLMST